MAERILVSTEEINATIAKYTSAKDAKLAAIAQMDTAVRTMDGYWDGPASEAFKTAFTALHKNLSNSEARMQDAIDELNKTVELITAAENDTTASGNSIDPGPTFG